MGMHTEFKKTNIHSHAGAWEREMDCFIPFMLSISKHKNGIKIIKPSWFDKLTTNGLRQAHFELMTMQTN